VGTIRNFTWPVAAVVLVDVKKEQTALREAKAENVPVVALVDTNSDPSMIDYVIPCNDDAKSSIELIINYLADAVERGQSTTTQRQELAESAQKVEEEETTLDAIASTPENSDEKKPKKDLKPKRPIKPRTKSSK
jgi:small subunit ribosomal protein S2